jgi:hypothetical protein
MTSVKPTAINPLSHHNMSVTRLQDHKNKKVVPLTHGGDSRLMRTQSVDLRGKKLLVNPAKFKTTNQHSSSVGRFVGGSGAMLTMKSATSLHAERPSMAKPTDQRVRAHSFMKTLKIDHGVVERIEGEVPRTVGKKSIKILTASGIAMKK